MFHSLRNLLVLKIIIKETFFKIHKKKFFVAKKTTRIALSEKIIHVTQCEMSLARTTEKFRLSFLLKAFSMRKDIKAHNT